MEAAIQTYKYMFDELSDPRTKDWWLVLNPGPLLTILATYLYFCIYAGPKYMKSRKPYDLKPIVMCYNLFQIILSIYLACMGLNFVLTEKYVNGCYSIDYSSNPRTLKWTTGVWWFYFAKLTELLDTVFFVLRKKERQITFLHLYHHTIMPIIGFLGIKYAAGGQSAVEGSINAFIHIIMYTYYFVSGLGPQYQKYLWWKKYVTSMQLIQFCIISVLNYNSLRSNSCNYPKFIAVIVLLNCFAFFYMFGKFYYKNYVNFGKENYKDGLGNNAAKKCF